MSRKQCIRIQRILIFFLSFSYFAEMENNFKQHFETYFWKETLETKPYEGFYQRLNIYIKFISINLTSRRSSKENYVKY